MSVRLLVAVSIISSMLAGCATMQTDTGKGALIGGVSGAAIGALIEHDNPWGALIGAAGGALAGGLVGHYMDDRNQDLSQALNTEINAGQASVRLLPGNSLAVTMTGQTAFAPGSAVLNPGFIPTLRKIAGVVSTYGKMTINVIGHPDNAGTWQEREYLANQRAEAVRVQFIGMGVKPVFVSAAGNPNSNYLDGRVELILAPIVAY